MDTAELDAFFARADDVLTDWEPSADAMVARVPGGDSDDLAPEGDSYYEQWFTRRPAQTFYRPRVMLGTGQQIDLSQVDFSAFTRAVNDFALRMTEAVAAAGRATGRLRALNEQLQGYEPVGLWLDETTWDAAIEPQPESPAERVMRLRRERNTGPASRVGLDGRRRRTQ